MIYSLFNEHDTPMRKIKINTNILFGYHLTSIDSGLNGIIPDRLTAELSMKCILLVLKLFETR